jgi:hypothetical protein
MNHPSLLVEIDLETSRPQALVVHLASGRTVRALLDEASAAAIAEEIAPLAPPLPAPLPAAPHAPRAPRSPTNPDEDGVPSL